jgi:hypothetical protein
LGTFVSLFSSIVDILPSFLPICRKVIFSILGEKVITQLAMLKFIKKFNLMETMSEKGTILSPYYSINLQKLNILFPLLSHSLFLYILIFRS